MTRIYLDNAATSYPKPESVYAAVDHYQRNIGVAVGRGAYREAVAAQRMTDQCRQSMARLIGAESSDRIVFTLNGTDSLNLALMGICRAGDHVVTTEFEHNSVLRPLRWLKDHRGIDVTILRPHADGRVSPDDVRASLRPTTRLLAVQHASNVTGVIQPIEQLCEIARSAKVLTLIDAAQTVGHTSVAVNQIPIDLLACPGHKGLLGPLGTGVLYVRAGLEESLIPHRVGGTGTHSDDDRHPETMPERFEAGNHNAPGLAGLGAALDEIQERSVEAIQRHEQELTSQLVMGLKELSNVTVYGHYAGVPHVGVISFNIVGFEPHEVASILDESFGVQARAGLHCAPGVHRFLGTSQQGGTVRFSVGAFTTAREVEQALAAVRELATA